jgi:anti-sigma regulatory factor (Ser/Thr protein kinase)
MSESPIEQPLARVAFSYPAAPSSIREVRRLAVAEARTLPFGPDDLDDIALAVSEAFTNLVQYAPEHRIRGVVEAWRGRLEIRFSVEHELARYLERRQFPGGLSRGGRGIPLLHMLVTIVEVQERSDGTAELRLVKPVPERSLA